MKKFIKRCKHKCVLAVFDGEKIISMLFLVDCEIEGEKGKYVYAVSTDEGYRKQGLASELLKKAKEETKTFLCLIPANEGLKEYYSERGFITEFSGESVKEKLNFNENKKITADLFEGTSLESIEAMVWRKQVC